MVSSNEKVTVQADGHEIANTKCKKLLDVHLDSGLPWQWCYISIFQAWWKNRGLYELANTLANEVWKYMWVFLDNFSWYIWMLRRLIQFQQANFCFNGLTSWKLKIPFLLQLALIARKLGCFLYSRIVFKIGSLTFSIIGPKSEYWKMLRFFTRLPKIIKNLSCVFFSFHNFTIFTQTYPFSGIEFFGWWRLYYFSKKFVIRTFPFI